MAAGFGMPHLSVTLTFDCLNFDLENWCASSMGNLIPNLGTLGLCVLELFAVYATGGQTDRRTDKQTDKSNAYCPLPYDRGHNNEDAKSNFSHKYKGWPKLRPLTLLTTLCLNKLNCLDFC